MTQILCLAENEQLIMVVICHKLCNSRETNLHIPRCMDSAHTC